MHGAVQGISEPEAYLVFPKVDRELVDSVLAEVTREHVARARAVTERVRHGGAGCLSCKHHRKSSNSSTTGSIGTSRSNNKRTRECLRERSGGNSLAIGKGVASQKEKLF